MAKTEPAAIAEAPGNAGRRVVRGRPKPTDIPKVIPFFKRVSQIAKEDWGTRASLKLYRLEPVINRLATSDNKYICVYHEPVNEERIKQDFGSGKYRLYLNFRMPTAAEGAEIDSLEMEIMDQNFPPKIPIGEWVDAPKNREWKWAKEKLEQVAAANVPPPPSSTAGIVEVMRTVNEIQDSAIARGQMNQPAAADPLALVRAVKELMPAPQAESGMLQTVVSLFTKQMEAQSLMMQMQMQQMQTQNSELRSELRSIRDKPNGNGVSTFKEIIGEFKTIIPEIKELWPVGESRGRGTPWWTGIAEEVARGVGPVAGIMLQQYFANASRPAAPPNGAARPMIATPGAPMPPPGASAPAGIGGIDLDQALLSVMDSGSDEPGDEVAHFLNTMYGDEGRRLYETLRQAGEAGILQLIQSRPVWEKLGHHQARMPLFIQQFLKYGQEGEEKAEENASITPATVEVI